MSGVASILVIEDEEGLRRLVYRVLHEAGHEVLLARESVKGLSLWRSHEVDLVVADLGLPGRSGLETIIDMRTLKPGHPIIVISGRGEEELIELMTGAGLISSVQNCDEAFRGGGAPRRRSADVREPAYGRAVVGLR